MLDYPYFTQSRKWGDRHLAWLIKSEGGKGGTEDPSTAGVCFVSLCFHVFFPFHLLHSLPSDQKTIKTYGITMATIITTYKTACKLWNNTNRPEQPWLAGCAEWLPSAIKLFESQTEGMPRRLLWLSRHMKGLGSVLSPLYLMVMDKLSVAYHLMLGLGVWCFSRVTVCWVDRFGLLIAVWWFWYVGCVEQVKSFMQWRLQIAFSCPSNPPSPPPLLLWFIWCLDQSIERAWALTHAPSYFPLSPIPSSFIVWALNRIFSTQNKWYNYNSLLSLTQANYSVIMVRISYAPSRCVSPPFPLKSHASCAEKSLLIKGWVRLSPRTRSVDVDCIDHECQTQSESKATLESSDSTDWTHIKESRHKDTSTLMCVCVCVFVEVGVGGLLMYAFNLCPEINTLLL